MLLGTESARKRNAIIGLIIVAIVLSFYYLSRLYLPGLAGPDSRILNSNYSLISTFITSLTIFIYLGVHSAYLGKKKLFLFSIAEFVLSILVYVAGFLFLSHDGGYFGFFAWTYALGAIIFYVTVWGIFFVVQVARYLYEKK